MTKAVQYGNGVKAQAVYLSQYQLFPYQRVQDYFQEQVGLPISTDSVFNFNQQAFELLAQFEQKLINRLLASPLLHADEPGINVDGKKQWLHCVSNDRWTLFYAPAKRGTEAMNTKGMLPQFKGIHCHDHWNPKLPQYSACPPPDETLKPGQSGRVKHSKTRNLSEGLQLYEQDVLRFITHPIVPFINNQGENSIRMTKAHHKISGCIRTKDGADIFCRVRSYLSTWRKNNVSASQSLTLLFDRKLPNFIH